MVSATLSLTIFLTLIVWRLVFGLHLRQSLTDASAPQRRDNNFLDLAAVVAIAGDRFADNSHGAGLLERKDHAKTYLRRIVALTGATRTVNRCILDVGKTRFVVRDRNVRRLRDSANPHRGYDETCFYSVHEGMPREEEIATVLLQLKSNPALFDNWVIRNGQAFKADGQVFTRPQ